MKPVQCSCGSAWSPSSSVIKLGDNDRPLWHHLIWSPGGLHTSASTRQNTPLHHPPHPRPRDPKIHRGPDSGPALRRSGGVGVSGGGGGGEDGPELQVWTGCKHWRNVRPVRNCHHVTGGNVDLESLSVSPSWTKYDKYCIDDSDRSTAVLPLFRLTSLRRTEVLSLDSWLHQVARGHGGYSVRLL